MMYNASTSLKRLSGGTGGKVLAMKMLKLNGEPALVAWSQTSAVFETRCVLQPSLECLHAEALNLQLSARHLFCRSHTVNAVSVYSVVIDLGGPDGASEPSVTLKLSSVMMTLPLGVELKGVRSIDLPLVGSVQVAPSDVTVIPYVGDVDLIGEQDWSNINIQQSDAGFVIKGSVSGDRSWWPFMAVHACRHIMLLTLLACWRFSGRC